MVGNYARKGERRLRLILSASAAPEAASLITARQIRAARGLLSWSQDELARRAGISRPAVNRIEGGADVLAKSVRQVEAALVEAGIAFLPAGSDEGEGVRLARPD
jgi:transcriptional regulator with XRE-family HTH domain